MPQLSKLTPIRKPLISNGASKSLALTFGTLAMVVLIAFVASAWTEPSVNPPNPDPNISTPLNIGSTGQSKAGNLTLHNAANTASLNPDILSTFGGAILNTGGAATGLIVQNGDVKIGNATLKGDGSVSTGLNTEKVGGYTAVDLMAAGGGGESGTPGTYFLNGGGPYFCLKKTMDATGLVTSTTFVNDGLQCKLNMVCHGGSCSQIAILGLSNSGGGGWLYRRSISVSGSTLGAQINYPVKVTLTTAVMGNPYNGAGVSGSDIRFTNSAGTELSYWIESYNNIGTSIVWVKVDSIPASPSSSNINMYYGNVGATSSSSIVDAFGTSSATSTLPGCTLGQACIITSSVSISSAGTYGHPYIKIASGGSLSIQSKDVYLDGIRRFDIEGSLSANANVANGSTNGGTYWGTGSGGTGGSGQGCDGYYGNYGGGGGAGTTACGAWRGSCAQVGYGGSYGGGSPGVQVGWNDCSDSNSRGAFLSIKADILRIAAGSSIILSASSGCTGRDLSSGGGGALFETYASNIMILNGQITATGGGGGSFIGNPACGTGGGGGVLSYLNYSSFIGTGTVSLTAGNGGSGGPAGAAGGYATLILPAGTVPGGSPSGLTGGTVSKSFSDIGSEPLAGTPSAPL